MALEITPFVSLDYFDSELDHPTLALPPGVRFSITTKAYSYGKKSFPTSDTAIPLGSVTALGFYCIINRDLTNYCDLKVAAGGTIIAHLPAVYGFACGYFGSGVTAPVLIANTASVDVSYLILSQ